MPNVFKDPEWGPPIHAAVVILADVAFVVGEYLLDYIRSAGTFANWDWDKFLMGLAIAGLAALVSAQRNRGAVKITDLQAAEIKAIPSPTANAVMTTANRIVATPERVIVLRDTPPQPVAA